MSKGQRVAAVRIDGSANARCGTGICALKSWHASLAQLHLRVWRMIWCRKMACGHADTQLCPGAAERSCALAYYLAPPGAGRHGSARDRDSMWFCLMQCDAIAAVLRRHGGLHGARGAAEGRDGDAGGRVQLCHADAGAVDGRDRVQRHQLPPGGPPPSPPCSSAAAKATLSHEIKGHAAIA